jgi:hypothetical protein
MEVACVTSVNVLLARNGWPGPTQLEGRLEGVVQFGAQEETSNIRFTRQQAEEKEHQS